METTRDYYEVLGVERTADHATIKKAFRRLARTHHPDVNDGDGAEEEFKIIAAAYEVLSDSERRATYDRFGHEGLRSSGGEPDFSGFSDFGSIFEAFFGGGSIFGGGGTGAGRGPRQGGDLAVETTIGLAEVLTGKQVTVKYDVVETCQHCDGSRAEPGSDVETCERCGGSGRLRAVQRTVIGQIAREVVCDQCEGLGQKIEAPCRECDGQGRVQVEREATIDVPAGIADGQQIRVSGSGHAGAGGGPSGDLYVIVHIAEDERFHREGNELYMVVDIPAQKAMLGTAVEVETLDGKQTIEIDSGTCHGDEIKIKGHGLPGLRSSVRGDFHAVVNLLVPRKLSDEQRDLLEQFDATVTSDNLRERGKESIMSRLRRALR